jgi:DNA-binding transcriptional LysR family regulator
VGDVDIRILRTLVALADEGTMGRAAKTLHLSQPALSKQVALAEQTTGLRLFDRSAHGMTPTPTGLVLIDRARAVLRETDNFSATAARERRRMAGRLDLGFIAQAANENTPHLLREYRKLHPHVVVEMRQYPLSDLTGGLLSGETQLAFLRQPLGVTGLVHEPVLIEPRVAVLSSRHPLAAAPAIDVAELFGDAWVVNATGDPTWQRYALASDQRGGRPPRLGPTVHSVDEFLEAVEADNAVGLAPESARRYYSRPGVTYVEVRDAEPSICTLSWRGDRDLDPAARALVDLVRSRLPLR